MADKVRAGRRQFLKGASAVAAGTVASPFIGKMGAAHAAWPERPVKIIVPNSAGGPSDILARIVAPMLQNALGGSFFVENKGGGGGNIGMGAAARSEPDGYTLLLITSAYVVNPSLYEKLPYDPFKDFEPICEIATSPNVVTTDPKFGVKSMKELVALMKADQSKFNFTTPPVGTTPQVAVEYLRSLEGLNNTGVIVNTGGGVALQQLLSGAAQVSAGVLAPAKPHIDAGKIQALAIMSESRYPGAPDIPTMVEAGYPGFVFETFLALLAPAKTPKDITEKLSKAMVEGLKKPDTTALLEKNAFIVRALGPDGLKARIAKEVPMFKDVISKAGIKRK